MGLNRQQRLATTGLAGPVRVVAGAGTGKTAVIAERFQQLVAGGAGPSSILVMTFTERAAAEMRSRIEAGLGTFLGELWVGTFHSIRWILKIIEAASNPARPSAVRNSSGFSNK